MSKVSALVSAYYAEKYLDKRITNLFGQNKYVEIEPIVVCLGGSPEERVAGKYNVKVITTSYIPTIGAAWNMAIEKATGDYLTTANCDDRYHIGGLKRMVDEIEGNPELGLVFAQVDKDDGEHVYPWRRLDRITGEVKDILDVLKERSIIGPMPLWKRSIHTEHNLYFDDSMTVASDYKMWLDMAKAGVKFGYIEDSCGIYMARPDSLEHRNKELCGIESQMARRSA